MDTIRLLARELGITIRFAALLAALLVALVAAQISHVDLLNGVALVLALLIGTQWNREVTCDDCGVSLEEREPTETAV